MSGGPIDPAKTALVTIDLTNDFLHPEGAYGRAGQGTPELAALPLRVAPILPALRARGGLFASVQFTIEHVRGRPFLVSPHLHELRPFLAEGDFAPDSWGNKVVETLSPPDVEIEKVAYSAFYQTRMEHVMNALGIDTLVVAGIVTNGGVASTVRDAHMRGYRIILLTDGCGAFRTDVHDATLIALGSVSEQETCADFLARPELTA
ncbi:cysteine hydrolase family protein [Salipiger mucosus]|uniref:Nicotinamidase/isochorismatase family protein n=1 Tax=Salipiger mucosus DSM 16094 TaxID=1123237 RepID=S9SFU0_9RHOB|nr:isochorismatase family cysteine hydrolase [Salipiger mucosus]EPX85124.1 Nicotinamidase/isochorismatase family protein [Salipiger mucosus DSM 16094]